MWSELICLHLCKYFWYLCTIAVLNGGGMPVKKTRVRSSLCLLSLLAGPFSDHVSGKQWDYQRE